MYFPRFVESGFGETGLNRYDYGTGNLPWRNKNPDSAGTVRAVDLLDTDRCGGSQGNHTDSEDDNVSNRK